MTSSVDKVAVVTGASQGIGAGIVRQFRAKGYGVVACSRNTATTGQPNLVEVAGDISQPETATLVIERAKEHFGRVDTLVCPPPHYRRGDESFLVSFEPILVNFESSDFVVQGRRRHIQSRCGTRRARYSASRLS